MTIILALDQATKTGFSVFEKETKTLIAYGLGNFSKYKYETEKLSMVKEHLISLIETYKPDIIIFEDCQMQLNKNVFKQLSKLLGILENTAFELDIPYETKSPNTWRGDLGFGRGKREILKQKAITFVKSNFNIDGDLDDIAEAICIGYSATLK